MRTSVAASGFLWLVVALLLASAAAAQQAPTRTARLSFQGGQLSSGYEYATIDVRYGFSVCAGGEIWITYALVENSLRVPSESYFYNGVQIAGAARGAKVRHPTTYNGPLFAGGVVSGGVRVGSFSGAAYGALGGGMGCNATNFSSLGHLEDFVGKDASPERKAAFVAGLTLAEVHVIPETVRNAALEQAYEAGLREAKRQQREEEQQQRVDEQRAAEEAEREAERQRSAQEAAAEQEAEQEAAAEEAAEEERRFRDEEREAAERRAAEDKEIDERQQAGKERFEATLREQEEQERLQQEQAVLEAAAAAAPLVDDLTDGLDRMFGAMDAPFKPFTEHEVAYQLLVNGRAPGHALSYLYRSGRFFHWAGGFLLLQSPSLTHRAYGGGFTDYSDDHGVVVTIPGVRAMAAAVQGGVGFSAPMSDNILVKGDLLAVLGAAQLSETTGFSHDIKLAAGMSAAVSVAYVIPGTDLTVGASASFQPLLLDLPHTELERTGLDGETQTLTLRGDDDEALMAALGLTVSWRWNP